MTFLFLVNFAIFWKIYRKIINQSKNEEKFVFIAKYLKKTKNFYVKNKKNHYKLNTRYRYFKILHFFVKEEIFHVIKERKLI